MLSPSAISQNDSSGLMTAPSDFLALLVCLNILCDLHSKKSSAFLSLNDRWLDL